MSNTQDPARWFLIILAFLAAAPSATALEAEADKPYQLQVVLQVTEHRMLTDVFKDRLRRELRDSLRAALGDLAKVTVVDKHALLKEVEAKGLETALDAAPPGPLTDTKAHFVRVLYADGRYRIFARQLDGMTGLASPVVRREETTDPQYVARAAALLVAKDFGAVGTVEPAEGTSEVKVALKAGKLGRMNRWVQKGDVFAVVQIGTVRDEMQAERVPWALLRVEGAPSGDGVITCRLLQRYKQSLGGGPGVLGYRCIKLGTGRAHVRIRLIDEATRRPLPESISIRRTGFDGPADEQLTSDADGGIVSVKEYENVAFVQVHSGSSVRARVPVAIIDGRALVIPVAANPGAEARGQFDLRRRLWMSQLYESLLVVDDHFKELNQLVEKKEFDQAMKSAKTWLDDLKADLTRKEAEMTSLRVAGREAGQENPDLRDGEQRLQEMRGRRDELAGFADKMKEIKASSEQRKALLGMVERARLLEGEFEFAKAIELYRQIAEQAQSEPALRQSAETKRASLEKAWATRDRADVQDFVFRQWPKLVRAAELKEQMDKALAMFHACRDASDKLTPRMMLKTNLLHATRLEKRLKELQPKDREEDRREAEDIAAVAAKLARLTEEVSAYLREKKE
jgi:hypothetical protein